MKNTGVLFLSILSILAFSQNSFADDGQPQADGGAKSPAMADGGAKNPADNHHCPGDENGDQHCPGHHGGGGRGDHGQRGRNGRHGDHHRRPERNRGKENHKAHLKNLISEIDACTKKVNVNLPSNDSLSEEQKDALAECVVNGRKEKADAFEACLEKAGVIDPNAPRRRPRLGRPSPDIIEKIENCRKEAGLPERPQGPGRNRR